MLEPLELEYAIKNVLDLTHGLEIQRGSNQLFYDSDSLQTRSVRRFAQCLISNVNDLIEEKGKYLVDVPLDVRA